MATQKEISNETNPQGSANRKPLTNKTESATKGNKETPDTKLSAEENSSVKRSPKRTTASKTTPKKTETNKTKNVSATKVVKPAKVEPMKSQAAEKTTDQVHQENSSQKKSTDKKSGLLLRSAVDSGRAVADGLIRTNRGICMFWLDIMKQPIKITSKKSPFILKAGEKADQAARDLVEFGADHAYSTVDQAAKIANASISKIENIAG